MSYKKTEQGLKYNERFEDKTTRLNRGKDRYASKKVENCKDCGGHGRANSGSLCNSCEGTGYAS